MSCIKGSKLSKVHRAKIGRAHFGQRRSKQACKNISQGLKGRTFTRAWKRNMSLARMGGIKSETIARRIFEKQGFTVYANGWPDFLLVKGKTFKFIEVKRRPDRNNLRPAQRAMHDALQSVGIPVQIWWKGQR